MRDEQGREIRKAFVPSDDEHLLLSADYSQVELRLMAHLSGDAVMIDAFAHDADIHTATAARIFGVAPADVTREQRRQAKTANFGIIYGISAFGLAQRLQIPRTEAKAIIDGYFATFPGVKKIHGGRGKQSPRNRLRQHAVRTQADAAGHPFGQCGRPRAGRAQRDQRPDPGAAQPTS